MIGRGKVSSTLSVTKVTHNLLLFAYVSYLKGTDLVSGKKIPLCQARFIREVSLGLSQEMSFEEWKQTW